MFARKYSTLPFPSAHHGTSPILTQLGIARYLRRIGSRSATTYYPTVWASIRLLDAARRAKKGEEEVS